MKENIKFIIQLSLVIILAIAFVFTIKYISFKSVYKNQDIEVIIGKEYLYSTRFETEDPFQKINVDTIKVLDVKNGYVKFLFKEGFFLSTKIITFKECIREINQ